MRGQDKVKLKDTEEIGTEIKGNNSKYQGDHIQQN